MTSPPSSTSTISCPSHGLHPGVGAAVSVAWEDASDAEIADRDEALEEEKAASADESCVIVYVVVGLGGGVTIDPELVVVECVVVAARDEVAVGQAVTGVGTVPLPLLSMVTAEVMTKPQLVYVVLVVSVNVKSDNQLLKMLPIAGSLTSTVRGHESTMVVVVAEQPVIVEVAFVVHCAESVKFAGQDTMKSGTSEGVQPNVLVIVVSRPVHPVVKPDEVEQLVETVTLPDMTGEHIATLVLKVWVEHELEEDRLEVGVDVGLRPDVRWFSGTGDSLPSGPLVEISSGSRSQSPSGGPIGGKILIFGAGGKPWKNQLMQDQWSLNAQLKINLIQPKGKGTLKECLLHRASSHFHSRYG